MEVDSRTGHSGPPARQSTPHGLPTAKWEIAETFVGCSLSASSGMQSPVNVFSSMTARLRASPRGCFCCFGVLAPWYANMYDPPKNFTRLALKLPSAAGFEAIAHQLDDWGIPLDLKSLGDAYYRSRVLSHDQYAGLIRLLEIFGRQPSVGKSHNDPRRGGRAADDSQSEGLHRAPLR